jgi:hypothetical protein
MLRERDGWIVSTTRHDIRAPAGIVPMTSQQHATPAGEVTMVHLVPWHAHASTVLVVHDLVDTQPSTVA